MTNEQYLYLSYTLDGLFTIALSLCVCKWLYGSHAKVVEAAAPKNWATVLKRAFPFAMTLSALGGFLSVSYTATGCGDLSYDAIIKDRDYLVEKGLDQLSGAFNFTAFAVFLWGLLVVLILATSRPLPPGATGTSDDARKRRVNHNR